MADEKLIYYNREAGLIVADKNAIKNNLKNIIREAYGQDVLLDDNYPDGIIIDKFSEDISECFDAINIYFNSLDINNAEGVILDTIGNIRNDHRKGATKSTMYLTVTVTETVTFLKDTFTLIDDNGYYWNLNKDLTITVESPSTSNSGIGEFISVPSGVIQEPVDLTIASIDNNLSIAQENITLGVINAFVQGENTETDIEYRNRMNEYTVFNSVTLKENLIAKLYNLSYIKDVKIYYNNSTVDLETKAQLEIPSGRVFIMIKSNVDFDNQTDLTQEVFDVISDYKGLGTLCWLPDPEDLAVGKNYISVDPDNPLIVGISEFLVPATQTVAGVTINYVKTSYFDDSTTVSNIKDMVSTYINNKGIGDNLTVGDLINYLYDNTNEIRVTGIDITGSSNGILVNNDKVLSIDVADITLALQE